jgi:hypothetical protein
MPRFRTHRCEMRLYDDALAGRIREPLPDGTPAATRQTATAARLPSKTFAVAMEASPSLALGPLSATRPAPDDRRDARSQYRARDHPRAAEARRWHQAMASDPGLLCLLAVGQSNAVAYRERHDQC